MTEPAENNFESKLDVIVPIVDQYRKEQPFAIKSRLALALVFGFMDDREEVSIFMQKASKKTRSYFVNENGL